MSDNQSDNSYAWGQARAAIAQQPAKRDDGMPASADERKLRRMYCARVGIPGTYMDDGEAHGTEHGIQIDFMREPVADIAAKVMALEVARYECRQGAAIAQPAEPEMETRKDGKRVRVDRWEWGIRRIVALLWGNRQAFEIDDVVEAVRALVPQPANDGDDEALAHAVQAQYGAVQADAQPVATPVERIWTCKIGGLTDKWLDGADLPMRRAVQDAFEQVTGRWAEYCFSGWGGKLDEIERSVVENRHPDWQRVPAAAPPARQPLTDEQDPIVGHKTFRDGPLGFRHEPLRSSEAAVIMAAVEEANKRRLELMPDEQAAIRMMFEARQRLMELGWNDAIYCPKDGSEFDAIEAGSTGIHRCHYAGEWPAGGWWVADDGDLYPSRPVLYRKSPAHGITQEGE